MPASRAMSRMCRMGQAWAISMSLRMGILSFLFWKTWLDQWAYWPPLVVRRVTSW